MNETETVDLLISPRWVIPVEPAGVTLTDHSVAVRGGRIVAVCPTEVAERRFSAHERVALPEHVLIPGLVNLHTHAAMTLFRGIADDLPLMRWLQEAIWPAEAKHVAASFVRDGTLLAAVEMLRGGITCANEMYFFPSAAAEAFAEIGMRAMIGMTTIDFPTNYAADADDYLRKGLEARDRWIGNPLLKFAFAPHAPYTVSDATLERIVQLAHELAAPVHMHIHETSEEINNSVATYGCRPLARLEKLGLLDTDLIAVHAVHLDIHEIDTLAAHNCSVAHCPTSNMKLASGIAPVKRMADRGLRVGLGTDGAASNNRLDLFQEMRHAALLAKVGSGDASAFDAHAALRAATLSGAEALRMDQEIGSITAGKAADLVAVSLAPTECSPCFDPASHLVYVAGREYVSHVWINGQARMWENAVLWDDNKELLPRVRVWQTFLKESALSR
ncbi:TRZ/ATZ family hydrolase [Niveibacterium umoris]|uniref:5-methylthioadenosine/S-adenosylhomocysteine deaminase n=1 Tax=Niveibacterium umoris TaxID=1193620 RepID=A0A840BK60_9RHOO|nr:TRZ/ATZ family hydrolase [Niveibacterium umoris]MBB4012002.1 5-methylthioadenosine/S-adenosylhomocysteine deaminase [Niveibacterium umoris]